MTATARWGLNPRQHHILQTSQHTSQHTSAEASTNRRLAELPLSAIKVDAAVQIRRNNREEAIARYVDALDVLPRVVIYELTDEADLLLLSDGFHRYAAHQRAGRSTIPCEIRKGTREEALEYAVIANARSGEPLTSEERDDGVRRLHMLHPDWEQQAIAKAMSIGTSPVSRALQVQEIRKEVISRKLQRIPDSVLVEVAPAPKQHWEPLLEAADKRGWTREGIRQAVKNLADQNLPETQKRRILEAKADPVEVSGDGSLQVPLRFIDKKAVKQRQPVPPDPVGPDVAERLQPVEVLVTLRYHLASDKVRNRGLKQYKREAELIERNFEIVVNHEALDGFGDTTDPQSKGLVMLLRQLNRDLWKRLNQEGWPKQENLPEPVRR